MGDIPDRGLFRHLVLEKALTPYFDIVKGTLSTSLFGKIRRARRDYSFSHSPPWVLAENEVSEPPEPAGKSTQGPSEPSPAHIVTASPLPFESEDAQVQEDVSRSKEKDKQSWTAPVDTIFGQINLGEPG
ncbi:hypothetical protein B0H13DRAFT_2391326 [Mycena leptocephala]|nr:hypothetical protein B0H13DRAFT_2391326 [Mycena leptocephala]